MQKYGKNCIKMKKLTWPDIIPVFTVDDIIPPPPKEYEDKYGRRSFIGWLKEIFLFEYEDNKDYLWISVESRKNYKEVLDLARKECKIGAKKSFEEWEETASRKKQAAVLNAVRKKLGYVDEYYE